MKNNNNGLRIGFSAEVELIHRILQACVRENILPYQFEHNRLIISLPRNQAEFISNSVKNYAFKRLFFCAEVSYQDKQKNLPVTSLIVLLEILFYELENVIDARQWAVFKDEIENCLKNELALSACCIAKKNDVMQSIEKFECRHFLHYLETQLSTEDQLMFFEQWSSKGHPFHPCHKTKLGFTEDDSLRYVPDYDPIICLSVAAIHHSIAKTASLSKDCHYQQWIQLTFPAIYQKWEEGLIQKGFNPQDFFLIFIHPWQKKHIIELLFKYHLESNKLIFLPEVVYKTKATLSFRTLASLEAVTHPHIKLPVAVHATSALRTVSPASVQNGPNISRLLQQITHSYPSISEVLSISYEQYGLHLIDKEDHVAKHLSIIYRDNPALLIRQPQRIAMVVAALFQASPDTQNPLLIDLLQASGCQTNTDIENYFSSYVSIVLAAFFDLYLIYGIALEGHQQNTIAIFKQYRLDRLIVRDLGGIRVHMPTLETHHLSFEEYPGSATITHDEKEVTNKFLHTVIQCHLGEIIFLLCEYYAIEEKSFWRIIKNELEKRFDLLKAAVTPERWRAEYAAVMQNDWQLKNLMRMRFSNLYSQYLYTSVANPLRDS